MPVPFTIFAHRGFSSRQPEMTLAAYQEAIAWSEATGVPLGLECDVQLSADGQLVCLHDATLDRTSNGSGPVSEWSLADLRRLDFGSWKVPAPSAAQRSMVTLPQLVALVDAARIRGAEITLAIETKHTTDGGLDLERAVCRLLAAYGWDSLGAPVRLITFSVPAARLLAALVPQLPRSLLIDGGLGVHVEGWLPAGIHVAGVDVRLLRRDPGFVARATRRGHAVHAWTVNDADDIDFCRSLGVTGLTTDFPERVLAAVQPAEGLVA